MEANREREVEKEEVNGMLILLLMVPLVLLVFVVIVAVKYKENEERGEDMFKQFYIYLVLFTTLLMTIGGGISVFMASADMISPNAYTETFSDYKNYYISYDEDGNEIEPTKTEDELKQAYEEMVAGEEEHVAKEAKNRLIKSLGFIIIPFPVFLYFNRLRKAGEKEKEKPTE